jgi:predicted regulator of Ras-like GTPase activity (Roadblock/LC7/MglB family)
VTGAGEEVRASLATLRDVHGVTGSFVFAHDGRVMARELPPLFDDAALGEASGRLARLRDTFVAVGDELGAAVIRFGDHKLYLKALPKGMLCIVAASGVNMPAMRMAANLVGRRITPALETAAAAPPPPAAAPERTPTSPGIPAQRTATPAPPGMRRFRGRPVD